MIKELIEKAKANKMQDSIFHELVIQILEEQQKEIEKLQNDKLTWFDIITTRKMWR